MRTRFLQVAFGNGAQIWGMPHKIQLVNEDFEISHFLVKLSGVFFVKSHV